MNNKINCYEISPMHILHTTPTHIFHNGQKIDDVTFDVVTFVIFDSDAALS